MVMMQPNFGFPPSEKTEVLLGFDDNYLWVEADDQQINLTRFSLFFPEKRLFFQERASTFDFSFSGYNKLFYSRRIGIYEGEDEGEGETVRIYGGTRLVGRLSSWDVGFLDMQQAAIEDIPSQNMGVLRRRVFNPYSYVGGMITSVIGTDGSYNVAYGLHGIPHRRRRSFLAGLGPIIREREKKRPNLSRPCPIPDRLRTPDTARAWFQSRPVPRRA